jgi:anaerobic selenocysteine-containing dehydrogenase
VQSSAYLCGLASPPALVANPAELAALGVAEGEKVTVSSTKGSLTVAASADAGVAPGLAVLAWNLPGGRVGELIDSGERLNFVRVEPGGDK